MWTLVTLALAETPEAVAGARTVELIRQVEPRFPKEARRQQIHHAECSVMVRVTPEGAPDDLHVVACDEIFVQPTLDALARWRFRVTPPGPAQFRVVVVYDYPRKDSTGHVVLETPGADAPPDPPIEPVPPPPEPPPLHGELPPEEGHADAVPGEEVPREEGPAEAAHGEEAPPAEEPNPEEPPAEEPPAEEPTPEEPPPEPPRRGRYE